MYEINYNAQASYVRSYFYCGIRSEGLLFNAKRDLFVIAKFLVLSLCSLNFEVYSYNDDDDDDDYDNGLVALLSSAYIHCLLLRRNNKIYIIYHCHDRYTILSYSMANRSLAVTVENMHYYERGYRVSYHFPSDVN